MKIKNIKAAKIFRWIWRINAVLLLFFGLGGVGLTTFGILSAAMQYRKYQSYSTVNLQPKVQINAEWKLRGFQKIDGTDYLMSEVYSAQKSALSTETYGSATRNYLFLNSADKSSRWLVPNNNYLFVREERIGETTENGYAKNVKWINYQVVKNDTNEDGSLSSEDKKVFAVSDASGGNYAELINDIDEIVGDSKLNDDSFLIFFKSGDSNFVSELKISERKVVLTKELPKIKP